MSIPRKKLLLTVAAAGVLVKLAELLVWRGSTFRFYNFVPGLDMETLLRFSEWGTPGNGFFFTPHRALIAAWWALNGHTHHVAGIVATQALFGILGAVLCADLALKFCNRDRIAALACGAVYLCYGPFFIYEYCVLQETLALNLILLAFYAAVAARSRRGFVRAGIALGLCVIGRPTALFFVPLMLGFMAYRELRTRRRTRRDAAKKLLPALAGLLSVLCLVAVVNKSFGGNWNCFFNVMPYSLEFNAGDTGAAASGNPYLRMAVNAVSRAPRMFMPTEIPENLNYSFLCRQIPLLNALPGSGLLLPLALAGILLMLQKLRRPAALALLPIIALVLPLCVRAPIGRYRLTLIPYFILCAGYWLHVLLRCSRWRKTVPVAAAGLTFAASLVCGKAYLRPADFMTHALALERGNGGRPSPASLEYLARGWNASGFKDNRIGVFLYLKLVEAAGRGDLRGEVLPEATAVLRIGLKASPEKDVYRYYLALETADRGDFAGAEKLLAGCNPAKLGGVAGKYHFLYAEMLRRRGDTAEAVKHYRLAVNLLDPRAEYARRAREQLAKLVSAADTPDARGTVPAPPAAPARE